MKMSDEINLPVLTCNGSDIIDSEMYIIAVCGTESEAIAHAINEHDALVDGICDVVKDLQALADKYGCDETDVIITKLEELIK